MIKLIKPYISFEEVQSEFKEIFESGWFTKGKFVEEFREEIKNYTGIDSPYEAPDNPELVIDTEGELLEESVAKVIDFLKFKKIINYA